MNFEKYNKIINDNKYEMVLMFIYYNLKVNKNMQLDYVNIKSENIQKQLNELINFIYTSYIKDETNLDLGYICDKAVEYKNEILNNKISEREFLEKCYIENEVF